MIDPLRRADWLPLAGFRVILLQRASKDPWTPHGRHVITTNPDVILNHRGNVGVMGGSPCAIIDVDDRHAWDDLQTALGPLTPTVRTGSGKLHCYVQAVAGLPRTVSWRGRVLGQIIRLSSEYAVCPPSIHPMTRQPYQWLIDPSAGWPPLPEAWRTFLLAAPTPQPDTGPRWDASVREALRHAALRQPGARFRRSGIKFQCPGCRAAGHDQHQDNAMLFLDGRWGCALDPTHNDAIGLALGIGIPEYDYQPADADQLRALDLDTYDYEPADADQLRALDLDADGTGTR